MPTFAPSASTFVLDNAYFLAIASQAAYSADDAIAPALKAAGWNLSSPVQVFSVDANPSPIRGFVTSTDDAVILAFEGTANLPGWLTDGNIVQIPDPYTPTSDIVTDPMIHCGFATGLDRVWANVVALVQKQITTAKPLWVTGHSLGAALGTLAANRFAARPDLNVRVAGLYTFGSPRVGNEDFYRGYKAIHFRCVNNDDIVPHVPLPYLIVPAKPPEGLSLDSIPSVLHSLVQISHFTYVHVGSLKYFNRNHQLGEGTSDPELKELQMLDALAQLGHAPQSAATDHFIQNYVNSIKVALGL